MITIRLQYGKWRKFYDAGGINRNYWNETKKLELALGETWVEKRYGEGHYAPCVIIYYSPYGKYSSTGIKVRKMEIFDTKKEAESFAIDYMNK